MDKATFIQQLAKDPKPNENRQSFLTEYASKSFTAEKYDRDIFLCNQFGICTNQCQLRGYCPRQRIKFLIPAVVNDLRNDTLYPHEYMNEYAVLRSDHMISEESTIGNRCVSGL